MVSQQMRDKVLKAHAHGYSVTEIAKWLGITIDETRAIIIHGDGRPRPTLKPEFIEPKLF